MFSLAFNPQIPSTYIPP